MSGQSRATPDHTKIPRPGAPNRRFWARVELLVATPEDHTPKTGIPGLAELRLGVGLVAIFCISTGVLMALWAFAPTVVGWDSTAIVSESMAPQVRRGDTVVFRPAEPQVLEPGAVIRFFGEGADRATVHRIVEVDPEVSSYVTQGDANNNVDSDRVTHESVVGVGALLVPLVGWPIVWFAEGHLLYLAMFLIGTIATFWLARGAMTEALVKPSGPPVGPLGTRTLGSIDLGADAPLIPLLANPGQSS